MRSLDIGAVCIKTTGREAGNKAVVVEVASEQFVSIIGPKIRKRKCNIAHLIPTGKKISVTKGVSQKDLEGKLE